jgi:hypothetical protein
MERTDSFGESLNLAQAARARRRKSALATPTAEVIAPHTIDHPKPGHDLRGPADAGVVLATHPLARDAAASATSLATTRAVSTSMATRVGIALIALGLILLVGSPLVTRWQSQRGTESQA